VPLLKTEADKLSLNQLVAGVIEELITPEELFALLPFARVNGKAYVYNRENALPTVDFLDPNDTVAEDSATFTTVTTTLKIIAGDVDVDKFLQATESDHNDQKATQLAAKAKAMGNKFKDTLVNGDTSVNAKSFDGVRKLVTGGQTLSAGTNGAAMTLSMLDDLVDKVLSGGIGRVDCLMMRSGTIRAYRALLRAAGGIQPSMIEIPNFGAGPVIAHNGIPIIRNDFLPGNETQGTSSLCCSVYALRLNETDGLHGLYGGDSAGFVVEDLGTVQNKDATRTRIKWYTGLALKSTKSLARLAGITNI
jgi:hypothetical protein